jgi:hypothetical protein
MRDPLQILRLIAMPMLIAAGGCNNSQPPITVIAEPQPPARPATEVPTLRPTETEPQVRSDIDTIVAFARATTSTVDNYIALFANIHDDATAETGILGIRRLAAELKGLAAALPNIPLDPDREAEVTKQLAGLPLRMNSKDMSRVMNDPSLGPKVSPASIEFIRTWMSLLGEVARRPEAVTRQSEGPR